MSHPLQGSTYQDFKPHMRKPLYVKPPVVNNDTGHVKRLVNWIFGADFYALEDKLKRKAKVFPF